jgi:hypothetical protein
MPDVSRMPRQFRKAIQWIAVEDAPADDDPIDTLKGFLTVCLVADLWRVRQEWVATLVWNIRHPER